eukprot:6186004-Pleurochrysis_carterae.AAC.1
MAIRLLALRLACTSLRCHADSGGRTASGSTTQSACVSGACDQRAARDRLALCPRKPRAEAELPRVYWCDYNRCLCCRLLRVNRYSLAPNARAAPSAEGIQRRLPAWPDLPLSARQVTRSRAVETRETSGVAAASQALLTLSLEHNLKPTVAALIDAGLSL